VSKSSSTPGPVVLLGAADGLLLDDMLRLAAAAHVEPVLAHDVSSIQRWWSQADLIVVGADLARALVRPPVRRDRVLLVDRYDDRAALNETAVALGAEHVVVLPDDQAWLVDQVAAAGEGRPTGVVLPVVGCRGGAGASTLVAALARQAVDVGLSCVVVDADPTGADLDVLLDMADEPGLRWPDLVVSGGRLPAEPLAAALPRRAGVAVLCAGMPADVPLLAGTRASQGSSGAPAPSSWLPDGGLAPAVDALARAFDLVVLDVPRWLPGECRYAVEAGDLLLLVTTADLRGVASARRVRAELASCARPARLVVRTTRSGVDPEDVADLVPAPLAATLRHDRRVAGDGARGELVVRSSLRRTARRVLATLATAGDPPMAGLR